MQYDEAPPTGDANDQVSARPTTDETFTAAPRARGDAGRGAYVPLGTIATILLIIVLVMIIF